jgi:hypothetical protein
MKCYDVRRKLSALLDSAAEGDLRDAVARHLDGCAACRAELEALAGVDQVVARALHAAEEPPAGYFEGLWDRLEPQLGPDPELDEIRKLAAEVVSHSGIRPAVSLPAVATSLGQVVVPAARPGGGRRATWVAFGSAVAAAGCLVLGWIWLARGPREERVQSPPTTGPEPPPVVAVAPPEPKPETPAPPPPPPAAAAAPAAPAKAPRPAIGGVPRHEAAGAAKEAAPAAKPEAEPPAMKAEEILVPQPPAQPAPVLPEKLGHEEIERGMVKIASRVQACFDLHAIQGKVMVKVKILPEGGVGAAEVEGKPAGTEGGDCVAKAVGEAKFPPFRGPPMTIRYPFQAE